MTADKAKTLSTYLGLFMGFVAIFSQFITPYFISPNKDRDKRINELEKGFEKVIESYEYQNLMELAKHVKREDLEKLFNQIEDHKKYEVGISNDLSELKAEIKVLEIENKEQTDHINNLFWYKHPKGAYDH